MTSVWVWSLLGLWRGRGWRPVVWRAVRNGLRPPSGRRRRRWSPGGLEALEGRALLATSAAAYTLSGFQWANPAHITYSIAPDGVFWSHGTNDLNAVMDAKFGAGVWERQVARALATWEAAANINISPVADGPYDEDTRGLPQGDPRFGDIRFGGYPYVDDTTTLSETSFPPPNGSTAAGDVVINTTMDFGINSGYDLYSVMLHETGHALGLDHTSDPSEVMYETYHGVDSGLAAGDIAGIQALYGPRTPDAYQAHGRGVSVATAVDVSAALNGAGRAVVPGLSLATVGDTEYFRVVAPAGASGVLQVTAAAGGVSMLSPKVSLYDVSGRLLGAAANPSAWSDNVTATAKGVMPGQVFYVAVTGATGDVFSVGAYTLNVSFSVKSAAPAPQVLAPSPPPAVAPTAPSVPPDRFEPNNSVATATPLGTVTAAIIPGLSLPVGDQDVFAFQTAGAGAYLVGSAGTYVRVFDAAGRTVTQGANLVGLLNPRPGSTLFVAAASPTGAAVPSYSLAIIALAPPPVASSAAMPSQTPPTVIAPTAWINLVRSVRKR